MLEKCKVLSYMVKCVSLVWLLFYTQWFFKCQHFIEMILNACILNSILSLQNY